MEGCRVQLFHIYLIRGLLAFGDGGWLGSEMGHGITSGTRVGLIEVGCGIRSGMRDQKWDRTTDLW